MMTKRTCHKSPLVFLFTLMFILSVSKGASFAADTGFTIIKDHRGKSVRIPKTINRVATISDGMIAQVMTCFGVAGKIVATGSECMPRTWAPTYPGTGEKTVTYHGGMHTVTYLNPRLMKISLIAKYGSAINYEKLAVLKPDLLIARMGSCTLSSGRDVVEKSLDLVESLGIPVVMLSGPEATKVPDVSGMYREISLLGKVFGKEGQAGQLIDFLEQTLGFIKNRTDRIQDADKKKVLLLGLSPRARSDGAAGHAKGTGTLQGYFLSQFVNAANAYEGPGAWAVLNAEQILSIAPDVIMLITDWGYHPPQELYEAPYYQALRHLKAVKTRCVASLPFTPCNCEKRLEFPIDVMVMAKTAYPRLFEDIDLGDWILKFYQDLYGVDAQTAKELMCCQFLDWTLSSKN